MKDDMIIAQMEHSLTETNFPQYGELYRGKIRDNYSKDGKRLLITTDKLSAFDRIIAVIPFKGQILTELATYWFEQTKDIAPNHMIAQPDPQAVYAQECEPVMLEFVVRAYLTGSTGTSIWKNYEKGQRDFGGIRLEDGLKKNTALPQVIITPTTKALHGAHDENITGEEAVAQGLVTQAEWDQLASWSLALFERGRALAQEKGLMLVDTKFEFGRLPDGSLMIMDEILTPDSSRYWLSESYESRLAQGLEPENLNKEFLRLWLAEQGYVGEGELPAIPQEVIVETAKKYMGAYELLTGKAFHATVGSVKERLTHNLTEFFHG